MFMGMPVVRREDVYGQASGTEGRCLWADQWYGGKMFVGKPIVRREDVYGQTAVRRGRCLSANQWYREEAVCGRTSDTEER